MSEFPALPPRPEPPRRIGETLAAWLTWFGPARLVATACSVLVVAAGGYWLVRAPAPSPESGLPFAGAAVPTTVTLPPPVTSAAIEAAGSVVVHVAGAVERPGVYELAAAARVHTAIDAAGGASPDADLDGLNLASAVVDGQRIYVPVGGEVDPASVPSGSSMLPGPPAASGPVDLNRGSVADFEALPGVGPATAAAIIDDRARHGPFASVDELERVPGIGPAKLAALRDLVTV